MCVTCIIERPRGPSHQRWNQPGRLRFQQRNDAPSGANTGPSKPNNGQSSPSCSKPTPLPNPCPSFPDPNLDPGLSHPDSLPPGQKDIDSRHSSMPLTPCSSPSPLSFGSTSPKNIKSELETVARKLTNASFKNLWTTDCCLRYRGILKRLLGIPSPEIRTPEPEPGESFKTGSDSRKRKASGETKDFKLPLKKRLLRSDFDSDHTSSSDSVITSPTNSEPSDLGQEAPMSPGEDLWGQSTSSLSIFQCTSAPPALKLKTKKPEIMRVKTIPSQMPPLLQIFKDRRLVRKASAPEKNKIVAPTLGNREKEHNLCLLNRLLSSKTSESETRKNQLDEQDIQEPGAEVIYGRLPDRSQVQPTAVCSEQGLNVSGHKKEIVNGAFEMSPSMTSHSVSSHQPPRRLDLPGLSVSRSMTNNNLLSSPGSHDILPSNGLYSSPYLGTRADHSIRQSLQIPESTSTPGCTKKKTKVTNITENLRDRILMDLLQYKSGSHQDPENKDTEVKIKSATKVQTNGMVTAGGSFWDMIATACDRKAKETLASVGQ